MYIFDMPVAIRQILKYLYSLSKSKISNAEIK
jgi:hypothetical protein